MSDQPVNSDWTGEGIKIGPIHIAPGVQRRNVFTYWFAAFCTIGFLSFISFIQNYVLRVNIGMPESEIGRAVGGLSLAGECVLLLTSPFFGSLSDKVGRRPIYALGFAWVGIGFTLYSTADTYLELIIFRMFFAVGASMLGGMMATVLSDYAQNRSRGLMAAVSGWCNGVGALTTIFGLGQLPRLFEYLGYDKFQSGDYTLWFATFLCTVTALVVYKGLKPGKPGKPFVKVPLPVLMKEGVTAARENPRVFLAYMESFIARGDLLMIGTFFSAWAIQAGLAMDMKIQEATANAARFGGIIQLTTLLWAPIFGIVMDRIDRATAICIAMGLAVIGYGWVGSLENPVVPAAIPALVLLGIGEFSAIMSGQVLIAQEAPVDVRGSVLGLFAFCGAMGLLTLSLAGGFLFDAWMPGGPFILVAGVNGLILIAAIIVRVKTGYKSPKGDLPAAATATSETAAN